MGSYKVIGLMSGSSLDGLDIAYCHIGNENGEWKYEFIHTECLDYSHKWKLRLQNLVMQNAITYLKTHFYYGHYIGDRVKDFIVRHQLENEVDFIASHGQTIFHQPENMLTSQIGDGAAIAAISGYPVICDFRTVDIALEGQGTPIVPIGDKLLFSKYSHCLNLGGISNISFKWDGNILGYDICGVNLLLNKLVEPLELEYDEDGNIAALGNIHEEQLNELNDSWYFKKDYPKSLSAGWVSKVILPIFKKYDLPVKDQLRTACEHIAIQIGAEITKIYAREGVKEKPEHRMLITGGGAHNRFLIDRIKEHSPIAIDVPDANIINYKEALIIALMGVLRLEKKNNTLASVTGASEDTCGGCIYQGTNKEI